MCLIEKFTDVYSREIRRTRVIHWCSFSRGLRTCSRTRVYYHKETFYRMGYSQSKNSHERASPVYRIIEPPKLRRPKKHPSIAHRRRRKTYTRAFKSHMPFATRAAGSGKNPSHHRGRERERSPRPFVVDFPEESSFRRVRPVSSRAEIPTAPVPDKQKHNPVSSFQSSQRLMARQPRRPRERTPVAEREPRRQRQQAIPNMVEVHNHRSIDNSPVVADRDQVYQRNFRKVHFSSRGEDRDDTTNREHMNAVGEKQGAERTQRQFCRRNSWAGNKTNGRELAEGEVGHRVSLRRRHSWSTSPVSRSETHEEAHWSRTQWNTRHIRPRIIQDGHRQLAEAGDRIFIETQMRQNRESFARDFWSRTSRRPWNRGTPRSQTFHWGEEKIVYDGGYRRYGWRWR